MFIGTIYYSYIRTWVIVTQQSNLVVDWYIFLVGMCFILLMSLLHYSHPCLHFHRKWAPAFIIFLLISLCDIFLFYRMYEMLFYHIFSIHIIWYISFFNIACMTFFLPCNFLFNSLTDCMCIYNINSGTGSKILL
jgi:hypothetical protein